MKKTISRDWYLIDANEKYLGRFTSEIIALLRGKNKVTFAPHIDSGGYVVVVNADKVKVSADKNLKKKYYRFSGYPGGIKEETFHDLAAKNPAKIIRLAVWGMLPKNKLRPKMMKRLKIFRDANHPYKDKFK